MRLHQLNLGKNPNIRAWRNNVGLFYAKRSSHPKCMCGRHLNLDEYLEPVRTGLCPGSADLIGFESITITPAMIGKKIAVFRADEVKYKKNRLSPLQNQWLQVCKEAGAITNIITEDDL